MSIPRFSLEELKQQLTIPEAACLWCDLPFAVLRHCKIVDAIPLHSEHPELTNAATVLVEATDYGDVPTGRTEDGYPLSPKERAIDRDDLKSWLQRRHPSHRPVSLFGPAVGAGTNPPGQIMPVKQPETDRHPPKRAKSEEIIESPEPRPKQRKLLLIDEVAELAKIQPSTIYKKIARGMFPAQTKPGERPATWYEDEVQEWVNGQRDWQEVNQSR